MPLTGEYEPSASDWVREQVETYEESGGTKGNTLRDTGLPVVLVTYLGRKSGKLRKIALMKVEDGGRYALVASKGGAPENPEWFYSLRDNPTVMIQDGPEPHDFSVRIVDGDERASWWEKSVAAYPSYADYQEKTDRTIPVFVAEPA
jgi:deazaflavin-dependent oxidoreductase (nitroreductase family)